MLIRLFSETNLLEEVTFHRGLNIILGKYSSKNKQNGVNGIGKSTLVRLIDFLFLSDSTENMFKQDKYNFLRDENHNVILEFEKDNSVFFIKRCFSDLKTIYFGESLDNLTEYTKSDLRKVLTNKFFPIEEKNVYYEGDRFGTLISFFIKDDRESLKRTDPRNFLTFQGSSEADISLYNLYLLGIPTKATIEFSNVYNFYEEKRTSKNTLKSDLEKENQLSMKEIKSDKLRLEEKISILERSLQEYKFIENYKDVEERIIELTNNINILLQDYNKLKNSLRKIKASYSLSEEVNFESVKNIYNELLDSFGDYIVKNLEEANNFRKVLFENRNKFLLSKEEKTNKEIEAILEKIAKYEEERSTLYKILDEKGAMKSIQNTYEQLIAEKILLEQRTRYLKQIDEIETTLGDLDVKISESKRAIIKELKDRENYIDKLRKDFQEILSKAIFYQEEEHKKGFFDISINTETKKNQLPYKIEIEVPKKEALGQTRLNIVAYDLLVFFNNIYNKRKLPDFLIHDGVYHAIGRKTVVNILNYIFNLSLKEQNFQYITTFNEDEITFSKEEFGQFEFDWKEYVVKEYEETEEKTIFKRLFS